MPTSPWRVAVMLLAALLASVVVVLARRRARSLVAARAGPLPPEGAGPALPRRLGLRCAAVLGAGLLAAVAAALAITAAAAATPLDSGIVAAVGLGAGTTVLVLALRSHGGDGPLLLEWWRRPVLARRRVALGLLAKLAGEGRRPRDWPEAWVRLASATAADRLAPAGWWYGYLWAMDTGTAGVARALLERSLRHAGAATGRAPAWRRRLLAEHAFHVAWVWGDTAVAAATLALLATETEDAGTDDADRLRAGAAVALAGGDAEGAAAACLTWLAAATPPAPGPGGRDGLPETHSLVREWVVALHAQAVRRAAARPVSLAAPAAPPSAAEPLPPVEAQAS